MKNMDVTDKTTAYSLISNANSIVTGFSSLDSSTASDFKDTIKKGISLLTDTSKISDLISCVRDIASKT